MSVQRGSEAAGLCEAARFSALAAALFAMTRYAESPQLAVAQMVVCHLDCVAEDERCDVLTREVCAALARRWMGHAVADCPAFPDASGAGRGMAP
ncbi:hypothetical protein ACDA63_08730 [Uliginosibacterium sp. sgz301328]|uniref:hypothetical protein n=1 Tax=Uliginosibacterium sp. sgz301328 TaxID=3243764 RepID=UPI00359D8B1C